MLEYTVSIIEWDLSQYHWGKKAHKQRMEAMQK